jgi:hypothetical protein
MNVLCFSTFLALNSIPKPSVCSQAAYVFKNGTYEKSLCYVKSRMTYYKAQKFCNDKRMQLYRLDSPKAAKTVYQTATKIFGGSSKAVAFVEGREGNRCATVRGNGKNNTDWCQTTYTFFCEFIDEGKIHSYYFTVFL